MTVKSREESEVFVISNECSVSTLSIGPVMTTGHPETINGEVTTESGTTMAEISTWWRGASSLVSISTPRVIGVE